MNRRVSRWLAIAAVTVAASTRATTAIAIVPMRNRVMAEE